MVAQAPSTVQNIYFFPCQTSLHCANLTRVSTAEAGLSTSYQTCTRHSESLTNGICHLSLKCKLPLHRQAPEMHISSPNAQSTICSLPSNLQHPHGGESMMRWRYRLLRSRAAQRREEKRAKKDASPTIPFPVQCWDGRMRNSAYLALTAEHNGARLRQSPTIS